MRVQAESHTQEIREMEDKLTALRKELGGAKLQISELTSKNATMEALKCDLMSKIEELTAQKTVTESINAELVQEKQSSNHQKGTFRVSFRIFVKGGGKCDNW